MYGKGRRIFPDDEVENVYIYPGWSLSKTGNVYSYIYIWCHNKVVLQYQDTYQLLRY